MVLKLYGAPQSSYLRVVAVVLHEKKVPFELVPVDMFKGEHKSPGYLEKHPFGQVPYIDDDGFILYEARAITRYIEEKYSDQGPKLIPDGLKNRALFEQAASVEYSNFSPPIHGIITEKVVKPKFRGQETDEAVLQAHRSNLDDKLQVYDKILSKQKYLAGNEVTLVDIFHLTGMNTLYINGMADLIDNKPNLKRWLDEMFSRPSWKAVKDGAASTA